MESSLNHSLYNNLSHTAKKQQQQVKYHKNIFIYTRRYKFIYFLKMSKNKTKVITHNIPFVFQSFFFRKQTPSFFYLRRAMARKLPVWMAAVRASTTLSRVRLMEEEEEEGSVEPPDNDMVVVSSVLWFKKTGTLAVTTNRRTSARPDLLLKLSVQRGVKMKL